jgi:DNA-directed RNA polymerase specialized sigma24 family protein
MDAPPWKDSGGRAEVYSDEAVRTSQVQIIRACVGAGLSSADAEDLAQDVWTWIIGVGVPVEVLATPWLNAVVHNYILRFRRRSGSHREREGQSIETAQEQACWQPEALLESNELLDNLASLLPTRERSLLALIRRGYTLPEAARRLGIPPGSRAYRQGRLIACAQRALNLPMAIPIQRGTRHQI